MPHDRAWQCIRYGNGGIGGPFPDMAIAGLAIDRAHRKNGCLQILKGSHKMGRLENVNEEWGERHIDPARIELVIRAGCEPVFSEQQPGDCVFFHCNTIHQSFPNSNTTEPRWCYLNAFDSVQNAQFYKEEVSAAPMVSDSCVLVWGKLHLAAMQASGGDLQQTLRTLKSQSDLVQFLSVGGGQQGAERDWNETKSKLYPKL